jgi:hypothetical protein
MSNVEPTVEPTVGPTNNHVIEGKVSVKWFDIKNRNAKKVVITLPAKLHAPAGDYFIRLAKDELGLGTKVGSTVGSTEDLTLIEFLMDFFEENKKTLQSRIKPAQRVMFQKIVERLSGG